jgi:hypothetical protein
MGSGELIEFAAVKHWSANCANHKSEGFKVGMQICGAANLELPGSGVDGDLYPDYIFVDDSFITIK